MANDEHLTRLKEGLDAWDAWRKAHPDIRLDLIAADLNATRLSEAYLSEATLFRAKLSMADLKPSMSTGFQPTERDRHVK